MKYTQWIGIFNFKAGKAYTSKIEIDDVHDDMDEKLNTLFDHYGLRASEIEWMFFDKKPKFETLKPVK